MSEVKEENEEKRGRKRDRSDESAQEEGKQSRDRTTPPAQHGNVATVSLAPANPMPNAALLAERSPLFNQGLASNPQLQAQFHQAQLQAQLQAQRLPGAVLGAGGLSPQLLNLYASGMTGRSNHEMLLRQMMTNPAAAATAAATGNISPAMISQIMAAQSQMLSGMMAQNHMLTGMVAAQQAGLPGSAASGLVNSALSSSLNAAATGAEGESASGGARASVTTAHPSGDWLVALAAGTAGGPVPGSSNQAANQLSAGPSTAVAERANRPSPPEGSRNDVTGRAPVVLYADVDEGRLTPYQCLARKHLEYFEADQAKVEEGAQGRNKAIVLGQVGIRCRFCSHMKRKEKAPAAAFYPSKLSGLYQSAQNIINSHLAKDCSMVPKEVREQLLTMGNRKSAPGGGKAYWAEEAARAGVFEDSNGLRFAPLSSSRGATSAAATAAATGSKSRDP